MYKLLSLGILMLLLCDVAGAAPGDYVYLNCGDRQMGAPLQHCAQIAVSSSFRKIMIGDVGSETPDFHEDLKYLTVGFPAVLPIAIPREEYASSTEWESGGLKFKKVRSNLSVSLLGNKLVVDVIAVSKDENLRLSFWYSPLSGVQAIAFPVSAGSAEVYYCAAVPCLFAQGVK